MLLKLMIFNILFGIVFCKRQFSIGAIFIEENEEIEISFRSAIDRVNMHERSFEFLPIIEYAKFDDSFIMEKIVCNLLEQEVIAIFGPSSIITSDFVSSVCTTYGIPHFIYDWIPEDMADERPFKSMTMNFHPDNMFLARAYADIIVGFQWKTFTIIYETDNDLVQLQDVLQIHGPTDLPITVRSMGEGPDYRPLLKSIKLSGEHYIILHCNIDKIVDVLRQAKELRMLDEYQSIFIPHLDAHTIDFEELTNNINSNITTVRITDPLSFEIRNTVNDWEENEKRHGRTYRITPNQAKARMVLLHDAVWLFSRGLKELNIYDDMKLPKVNCNKKKPWLDGKRIIEFMKVRFEEGITGRCEFNEYGGRTFFTLYVLELNKGEFQNFALWDSMKSLTDLSTDTDSYNKKIEDKIHNKTFIVTSRIGAPFLMNRKTKDGEILEGNARYEGYSMDLIDNIARMLGFTYRFELAPDGKYGSYNKITKQWDGLVKQLLDGKADLAICDLTITSARRKAVDFTSPFMTLGISILFSKPISKPPELFSFLSPFALEVWVYMATAYLGVSLLLFALARMAPDDWESSHPCDQEPEEIENVWNMSNSTWLTVGSIMGQGCDLLPKGISTRLVTGMWWFFALMMLNSYTANLAAFLTSSRMDAAINSAEDLAAQSKIKYGAVQGGSTMFFFKESNFPLYQRMWAAMEIARPSVFTKSNDEGVDRVLKGKRKYAFFMESTSLEYIKERNCDLEQVGGWLDYKSYGIAVPFNSPYRKAISGAVLKLGESGTLYELKMKWWKERDGGGRCAGSSEESGDALELGIANCGGVFLVLGAGLLFAFIIGIFEFLWNINRVAVEEKITLTEAFQAEALFAAKFWINTKPVHTSAISESLESKSSKLSLKVSSKSRSRAMSETRSTLTNLNQQQSSGFSLKSVKSEKDNDFENHIKII